ncbi:hypothetical protein FA15DRAFT_629895 [Coprinopsis marcescibilis]|uniref:Uncharacterized protein n=1 Tax=Coprinopsis marcescibilis TaxID=230819 RepID=A0A5C3LPJ9_COPMA|nr:hypothetical protein FA15DRAFT_629895 [Coprinopsis marcescibilis]
MYTPSIPAIYRRDPSEASGLSRTTIIIIAVCAGVGALVACFLLYRAIRKCRSSARSAPLPPVQPLAHHREHNATRFEESLSRPQTWFEPNIPATHSFRRDSPGESKASLLGKESPLLSPESICSSADAAQEVIVQQTHFQHLPLPSPSYHNSRPGSSSSLNSSDGSCTQHPFPISSDGHAQPLPRSITDLRSGARRPRPISMSSMASNNTAISRSSRYTVRGVPHSPHNNIQIFLPTPLASESNSRESLALPTRRRQSGAYDRRSIADSWMVIEPISGMLPCCQSKR